MELVAVLMCVKGDSYCLVKEMENESLREKDTIFCPT